MVIETHRYDKCEKKSTTVLFLNFITSVRGGHCDYSAPGVEKPRYATDPETIIFIPNGDNYHKQEICSGVNDIKFDQDWVQTGRRTNG